MPMTGTITYRRDNRFIAQPDPAHSIRKKVVAQPERERKEIVRVNCNKTPGRPNNEAHAWYGNVFCIASKKENIAPAFSGKACLRNPP
jgi:hypothetical protein